MSFGDLKVQDLIYEDSSNNEITVVIADLATKSNPIFSGTVTVPTATAGDNSTKAASTAFVVASFAPKNAPAFTGSATGVNLTLSGDLTVNGTTTTINTTTLQVEDKNIEIGKVASPSDTTADGGGWTLLGSTNKTFNWLNATDSWTSSEHIEIASGKNLKVDGTTFFVDGTNNRVGIGSASPTYPLDLTGNSANGFVVARINNTASNGYARILLDREGGSTGSADISYAPGVFFAIGPSANDTNTPIVLRNNNATERMRILSDGKIGIGVTAPTFSDINSVTSSTRKLGIEIFKDGTDTASAIKLAADAGNGSKHFAQLGFSGANGTTHWANYNTGGTKVGELVIGSAGQLGIGGTTYGSSGQVLTSGGSGAAPSWTTISAAPEITGTTDGAVTAGDAITVTTDGELQKIVSFTKAAGTPGEANNTYAGNIQVAFDKISGKVAAAFRESSSISVKIGTVSGTTVSWGTKQTMVSGSTDPFAIGFHNNVLVFGYRASAAKIKAATVSGTVATFGSAADFGGGNNSYFESAFYSEGKARWVVLWRDAGDYPTYTKLVVGSVSGTTFSGGSVINVFTENSGAVGRVDNISMKEMPSVNKFVVCGVKDAGNENFILRVGEINASNNSVTWENDQRPIFFGTDNEFNHYGTKYEVSIGWNDTDKYAVATGRRGQGSYQQLLYSLKLSYDETTKDFSWDPNSKLKIDNAVTSNWNETIYIPELNQLMVLWIDQGYNDGQGYIRWKTIRTSGTNTLEIVDPSGGISALGNALGSNNRSYGTTREYLNSVYAGGSKILMGYRDISQSNKTYTVFQQLAGSNLSTQEFIGFASSSVGDNAALTVKVTGNTVTKSGLSAGKKHYLQSDGTLSTSADDPIVEAGIALTSTSLLIKG